MFSFGMATVAMESGDQVLRQGWNGKGMYLMLFSKSDFCIKCEDESVDLPIDDENENPIHHMGIEEDGKFLSLCDFVLLRTADGKVIPWNASQADMLAKDWMIRKA